MSEENVEVVERALAALNERDIDGYLACCTEDIQLRTPVSPVAGVYEGSGWHPAVLRRHRGAGPDFRLDLERLGGRDQGPSPRLPAFNRSRARQRPAHPAETGNVYEFEEGKIGRIQIFLDREEALEAAGLSE